MNYKITAFLITILLVLSVCNNSKLDKTRNILNSEDSTKNDSDNIKSKYNSSNSRVILISSDSITIDCDQDSSIHCFKKIIKRRKNENIVIKVPPLGINGSNGYIKSKDINSKFYNNFSYQEDFTINITDCKDGIYLLSLSGCSSGGGVDIEIITIK